MQFVAENFHDGGRHIRFQLRFVSRRASLLQRLERQGANLERPKLAPAHRIVGQYAATAIGNLPQGFVETREQLADFRRIHHTRSFHPGAPGR